MKWIFIIAFASFLTACNKPNHGDTDADTNEETLPENNQVDRHKATEEINNFLDNWHHAATVADEDGFYGAMTEDCIYLGTDPTEKWKRDELRNWAVKAFEGDTAWAFTPFDRQIYLSDGAELVWFDEKLKTWMGECRGSGIVVLTEAGWKLKHYNLAVTITNEKIGDFMAIEQ